MNATARIATHRAPARRTAPAAPRHQPGSVGREPSDMAKEMLTRVIGALARSYPMNARERAVLFHFLFGRCAAATGEQLELRETTVHKHLHRIYAKTRTSSRRRLLELGLRLSEQHEQQLALANSRRRFAAAA